MVKKKVSNWNRDLGLSPLDVKIYHLSDGFFRRLPPPPTFLKTPKKSRFPHPYYISISSYYLEDLMTAVAAGWPDWLWCGKFNNLPRGYLQYWAVTDYCTKWPQCLKGHWEAICGHNLLWPSVTISPFFGGFILYFMVMGPTYLFKTPIFYP